MGADTPARARPPRRPPCPICRRPSDPAYGTFCSARCRDQDLSNWLGGRYAIPAVDNDPDENEESDTGDQPG